MDDFDYVISGEEVERGKPIPDVYIEAAWGLDVKTDNRNVLEDSKNGVLAAKSANMKCIGYLTQTQGIRI